MNNAVDKRITEYKLKGGTCAKSALTWNPIYISVETMIVKNTGIKNFGVGTCTFVDFAEELASGESETGGILEFM